MKIEQCITKCYTVYLSTAAGRSIDLRFDFKPSISDVFAAMKVIAHKGESHRIDMEILTQMLVLIKTPDFRRMVELGQGGGTSYVWVADVQVGSWWIGVTEHWNTWIQNWRAEKPVPPVPPIGEDIPL